MTFYNFINYKKKTLRTQKPHHAKENVLFIMKIIFCPATSFHAVSFHCYGK